MRIRISIQITDRTMAQMSIWRCLLSLLLTGIRLTKSWNCDQKWDDVKGPHTVDESFQIHLLQINTTEEFYTYLPNTKYQITVKSDDPDQTFTRFFIGIENENKTLQAGKLLIYDSTLSQYSPYCPDAVVQISQVTKDHASAYWISPPDEGGGCVIIRALIMDSPERWFMDGGLEKKICQDPKAIIDDPGPILSECCACDEAKYELSFEGLWTRYTHPRNFPSKLWSARFSDVIGASHTSAYRFWELGGLASEGLKQVAQEGLTRILESELKNQSENIRTIIKAKGINYPNITSKTFAVFRVDQQHHLMSVVSMIDPSPDWFVGVSGLELCTSDCSWVEQRELNLYPMDAGTDDGLTYESQDSETDPQEPIRRITTSWPNDERSPFYDETAVDMNPLAKISLKRQRIYEKDCERLTNNYGEGSIGGENDEKNMRKACRVGPWGEWSECSVTCGMGFRERQRSYKNSKSAQKHNCDVELTERTECSNEANSDCPPDEVYQEKCQLSDWGNWTQCTKPCGPEFRTRSRNFLMKKRRKNCKLRYPDLNLHETEDCGNPACQNEDNEDDVPTIGPLEEQVTDNTMMSDDGSLVNFRVSELVSETMECRKLKEQLINMRDRNTEEWQKKCIDGKYTPWSTWSPCSVSCGIGIKTRTRHILPEYYNPNDNNMSLYECQYESTICEGDSKSCDQMQEMVEEICTQPSKSGHCEGDRSDNSLRYYYNSIVHKCFVFRYTGCNGNLNNFRTLQECEATCGKFQEFKKMVEKKRKKKQKLQTKSRFPLPGEPVDCKVSEWTDWSVCATCKGYRVMSREILVHPRNGGTLCPSKLIRRQKCHKVMPECNVHPDQKLHQKRLDREGMHGKISVNCKVSPWGLWSPCTATCGPSQRRRIRNIEVAPYGPHGKLCPPLAEIEDCDMPLCSGN